MPGLLSASELDRPRIERLLASAGQYRRGGAARHPEAVVALAFFEDSLRTRVGFEAAAARLGARGLSVTAFKQTEAMGQPESLLDTVRSIDGWCDVLCLRHPDAAAVRAVGEVAHVPVINCGGGRDEHPTQALVDLFAIQELRGAIDGLTIGLLGDLHAMRTAHSLALALARFDRITVRCIGPAGLELPERFAEPLRAAGHSLSVTTVMDVEGLDVLYVAGLPAHTRAGTLTASEQARFHVTCEVVRRMPADALVLSPLPRVDEIRPDVDSTPQAVYFRQSALGLNVRMAVLDEQLSCRRQI